MPNNLIREDQIPASWEPVDSPTIVPGKPAAAPAVNKDIPSKFEGSLPPSLQHDVAFVGTEIATPAIPSYSIMPLGTQSNAFTNAAIQSTSTTVSESIVTGATLTFDVPDIFSPQTQTVNLPGTLSITLATQTANTFFAGPASGPASAPFFRSIVSADVPPINLASNANGGVTGILPVANGGTGDASFTPNEVLVAGTTSTSPLTQVPAGTSGYVLTSNGSGSPPTFQPASASLSLAVSVNGVGVALNKQYYENLALVTNFSPTTVWDTYVNGSLVA